MQIGLGIGAPFRVKWVPPLTEQIRSLLFSAGQQGGVYLFEKAHQASAFQGGAYDTPLSAVEQFIGSFYDLSGNANHYSQTTSAARAKWSARYNLVIKSQDLTSGWTLSSVNVAISGSGPNGISANKFNTTNGVAYGSGFALQGMSKPAAAIRYSFSAYAKAAENDQLLLLATSTNTVNRIVVTESLTTGNVLSASEFGAFVSGTTTTSVEALSESWFRPKILFTSDSDTTLYIRACPSNSVAGTGDGTKGIFISGVDVRYAGWAHLPYQRVTSATDYDTAGFPPYLLPDGADDYYTSASGGGSTTGLFICAAIAPLATGAKQVIWSDASGNTGYELCINASNQVEFSAGTGSARVSCVSAALSYGAPKVITAQHDGTTLTVRVDGVATTAACGAASAGTAGTTLLRANGAASSYAKLQLGGLVHRHGAQPSTELLTFSERFMANLQGRTL